MIQTVVNKRTKLLAVIFPVYSFFGILYAWSQYGTVVPHLRAFFQLLQGIIAVILGLMFVDSSPKFNSILSYLTCVFIGSLSLIKLHDPRLILFFMFSFASIGVNYIQVLKNDLYVKVLALFVILIGYLIGVLQNVTLFRTNSDVIRNTYGFNHPNFLSMLVMIIMMEFIIVNFKKYNAITMIIFLFIIVIIKKITDARAEAILSGVAVVSSWFLKNKNNIYKIRIFRWIYILFPEILAIFSFYVLIKGKIGTKLYTFFSTVSSGRLDIIQDFYNKSSGIHLWPEYIFNQYKADGFGIDNAYLYLLISFGLASLVVFCIIESIFIYRYLKYKDYLMLTMLLLILILGIVESPIVYPYLSFYAVSFGINHNYEKSKGY